MSDRIPLVDLRQGYLRHKAEIDEAILRVADSGWYILGKEVAAFEQALSQAVRGEPGLAVGVANGTDAIVLALLTLGVAPGDMVLTVSHTAVATVSAIEMIGATPVLVDIDPTTLTLDPGKLDAELARLRGSHPSQHVAAVIAVHIYGHPCDLTAIIDVCRRHGVFLIEDCAQAQGATHRGKPVGSFGDASTFSFYPTKNLGALGDGGAVTFAAADHRQYCAALREYGWTSRYSSEFAGRNSRLDEMQAAILSVRLPHLAAEVVERQAIARSYDEGLARHVRVPTVADNCTHAYHLYVVQTPRREALREWLQSKGVGVALHYPWAVHQQPAYRDRIRCAASGLTCTEEAYKNILTLPMYPGMPPESIARVIDVTQAFFAQQG